MTPQARKFENKYFEKYPVKQKIMDDYTLRVSHSLSYARINTKLKNYKNHTYPKKN